MYRKFKMKKEQKESKLFNLFLFNENKKKKKERRQIYYIRKDK